MESKELLDSHQRVATRRRRRLTLWGAFALLGIMLGAVWAAGFASVDGQAGTTQGSDPVALEPGTDSSSTLAGAVTGSGTFDIDWKGRKGAVADQNLFEVDLSGKTGTYFLEVAQTEDLDNAGWTTLQLGLRSVAKASGSCADSDMNSSGTDKALVVETTDASVTFNGLAGGSKYCVGLPDGADDANGTFLRRKNASPSTPSAYPKLQAVLSQSS